MDGEKEKEKHGVRKQRRKGPYSLSIWLDARPKSSWSWGRHLKLVEKTDVGDGDPGLDTSLTGSRRTVLVTGSTGGVTDLNDEKSYSSPKGTSSEGWEVLRPHFYRQQRTE